MSAGGSKSKGVGSKLIPEIVSLAWRWGIKIEKPQNKDGDAPANAQATPRRDFSSISPAAYTLNELGIIKLAAQFAARYGGYFWSLMKETDVFRDGMFESGLFHWLVDAYERVLNPYYGLASKKSLVDCFFRCPPLEKLEEGVETETAMIDLHAFVAGVDSFAHMDYDGYSANMPQPERLSLIMNRRSQTQPDMLPLGSQLTTEYGAQHIQPDARLSRIPLVELGIIKLTAQFVARYGSFFRWALMRRVVTKPQFEFLYFRPKREEFMEQTENRYNMFIWLVGAYSNVVKLSKKLWKRNACTATLVEGFLGRLQLEKLEEGVETAMVDLHALVRGVDHFVYMENAGYSGILPPPERLSMMMNNRPPLGSQFTVYPAWNQNQDECAGDTLKGLVVLPRRRLLFKFPARGITLKELGIIKLAALFSARYGEHFSHGLMERVCMKPLFGFLMSFDSRFTLYTEFSSAYAKVLKLSKKLKKSNACAERVVEYFLQRVELEKLEAGTATATAMLDLHAFMDGVDYIAHMNNVDYSAHIATPKGLSMMINGLTEMQPDMLVQPSQNQGGDLEPPPSIRGNCSLLFPEWIELKELGIMKLTALFVARYGMYFYWDLMKKVAMKPQFKFMEPSDRNFSVYHRIADAYERVIKRCDDDDDDDDACTETVLDAFFGRLQLEKLEEGAETAMIDLHAFLCGVDYFVQVEDDDHSTHTDLHALLSIMLNKLIPTSPGSWLFEPSPIERLHSVTFLPPAPPIPEEPEPKRQKFYKSALVSEDQFISPGRPTVRIRD